MEFREETRDCSPGHAGKEGPHFAMTGASRGFSRAAAPVWFLTRYDGELREPLVWRQERQVSMHVAMGSASLLSSRGRGFGPQDALKKDYRGLSGVVAGNPGFCRLLPVTSESFSGCL